MNRRVLTLSVVLVLSLAAATGRAQQTAPAPSIIASIPFEMVTRHIVLQVKVNNSRPLSFVFDTGDRVGIVDIERAKELGLKLSGQVKIGGAGSNQLNGSLVEGSNWTLPGLAGFSQPIRLAMPLGDLAARFGHDFDGIVGSEFIKQFVVEVDYQARVLRLHDKAKFNYTGSGEILPIQLNGQGHPILDGEVTPIGSEPFKGKFVLDLGSGGSLALHSPVVASRKLLDGKLKTIKAIGTGGAGGQANGQIGRVAELKIGKFKIPNPFTMFSEDKSGAFANTDLSGNIGQQIAGRFKIFLDYGNQRIILEPTASYAEPFERAFSGVALRAEDKDFKTFRVTEVLENSPAAEVGVKKDDVIIKIDDQSHTELTLTKVSELFEKPVPYKVTLRRGEQTLEVTLLPRKLV
jgi:hypothetical protein